MFEPKNLILALVLTAPFGLAIHNEITREKPDLEWLERSGDMADDRYGEDVDPYAVDRMPDVDELRARAELERQLAIAAAEAEAEWGEPEPLQAPSKETLNQIFGPERATFGPALAAVRFGLTRAELEQQAPTLTSWELRSDELGRVSVNPEFMTNNETELSDLVLEIIDPDGAVETYLRERWGAPTIEAADELPAIWISPDGHTRALIGEPDEVVAVVLSPVVSVQELVAAAPAGKGLFSFETGPALVGGHVDKLTASYPRMRVDPYYQDYATLDLPGIASDPGATPFTRVTMAIKSGEVTSLSFKIGCGERCADVVSAFEGRFGASKQNKRAGKDTDRVYRFETAPTVTLTIYAHEHRMVAVEVTR